MKCRRNGNKLTRNKKLIRFNFGENDFWFIMCFNEKNVKWFMKILNTQFRTVVNVI